MLTLWRPFQDLFGLGRDELDELYFGKQGNGNAVGFTPAADITEEQDHFLLSVDLPGVSEKDIEVKVEDGTLILSGKRETSSEKETENGVYRERSHGSFCRSFRLGETVDLEKIAAVFKNGVLTLTLPKKESVKPRQIPVSTN